MLSRETSLQATAEAKAIKGIERNPDEFKYIDTLITRNGDAGRYIAKAAFLKLRFLGQRF